MFIFIFLLFMFCVYSCKRIHCTIYYSQFSVQIKFSPFVFFLCPLCVYDVSRVMILFTFECSKWIWRKKHIMRKEERLHTSFDSSCIRITAAFCACASLWNASKSSKPNQKNHIESSYVHKSHQEKWMEFICYGANKMLHFVSLV